MPASDSPRLKIACPQCAAPLRVPAAAVGRRGQCNRCGRQFKIVAPAESPSQPAASPAAPQAKHVSFPCSLCETRMTASVSQVGRRAKCPDCGRLTVVPPPAAPRAPVIPAAMQGDQYAVWGVDEAPAPAELAAATPPQVPVECRLCGTLMYAAHDQIGAKVKCPDCGAMTVVAAPRERPSAGVVPVSAGEEYELDEASAPTPRPAPRIAALVEAERHDAARVRFADESRDASRGGRGDSSDGGRPPRRPRVPLVQGVAAMLLTGRLAAWWLSLSTVLITVTWFAAQGIGGLTSQMGAIMGVCFLTLAIMLGGCWFVAASALWLAVTTESADGHRRLHNPPSTMFLEWLSDAAFVFVPAATATLPAWLATQALMLLPGVSVEPLAAGAAVWAACFPVALLSALEEGSPMGVVSLRLWTSLVLRPAHWLLFYAEAALLIAGVGAAIHVAPRVALLLGPVLAVAASLVYFRLIGLLGWWLAESLATEEPEED